VRILFALHQFFPEHHAGVEIVTLGLAREFKARGHEPYVLAPRRSLPSNDVRPGEVEDYEVDGIPVRRVGRPEESAYQSYRLDYENDVMARRAREYVREVTPDVVHAMHFQGLSASVVPVFKEYGAPLVYTATDFWAVCPVVDLRRHDGVMCEGPDIAHCPRCMADRQRDTRERTALERMPDAALRVLGGLSGMPLSGGSSSLHQLRSLKERPRRIREYFERVDHIIAYTHLTQDLLLANGIGRGKIRVSPYGIDTSLISTLPRNRHLPPPLRVGFIGHLGPHKGCDILIRAFRSLPKDLPVTLDIYGNLQRSRPFVKKLRKLAEGDGRISFAGLFPRERVGRVLSGLDVLVVPSRWHENLPGVILEAFAAGMPVIASDVGGMSEFVKHEENGLLFKPEGGWQLAQQLLRLYEEPGLLERLRGGIGPVKTVEENADELQELYGTLLAGKCHTS
jgi:glycosyltransferase involved in cell wall biosynthesis